jgi:hypothetical protein
MLDEVFEIRGNEYEAWVVEVVKVQMAQRTEGDSVVVMRYTFKASEFVCNKVCKL